MTSTSDVPVLPQGTLVGGRYRIVRAIGSGGMGVVYEAVHDTLGQRLALKILNGDLARSADLAKRLEREAKTLARLESPHIARVIDVDVAPGAMPFMAMELLVGNDLDEEIVRRTTIPWREAVGYVLEACEAMRAAHANGIVHRDLKPANLFLHQADGRRVVKVLDFGISKITAAQDVAVTLTQSVIGTPLYMSPEQMTRPREVDLRTDVWALGLVLYELVTGVAPFEAETPQAVAILIATKEPEPLSAFMPGLPPALEAVVRRATQKAPADRFQTASELADALAAVLQGRTDVLPATTAPAPVPAQDASIGTTGVRARDPSLENTVAVAVEPPPRPRSSRALWGALGGVAVALGGVGIWLATRAGASPAVDAAPTPTHQAAASAASSSTAAAEEAPPTVTPVVSGTPVASAAPAEPSSTAVVGTAPSGPRTPPRRTAEPTSEPPASTSKPKPPTRL